MPPVTRPERPAELAIFGRVVTLAGSRGLAEVGAIAVRAGRVVASGPAAEIEAVVGPATVRLELGPDEVALPGLT
ncbi:MAG TPA: hypothetical protein VIB99_00310, partial [Candidatus Limnocylindrales bacterium]